MQEQNFHFATTSQLRKTKRPLMYYGFLLLACLGLLSALDLQPSSIAHAAYTSQPQVHYLIVTLNNSNQPVKVSPVDQNTFLKVRAEAKAKAQRMPRHPVPLINRVSDTDCANRSDFWKLWNNTTIAGGVCFANSGTTNINVFNVFEIDTGNNFGNFVASPNVHFPGNGLQFCAWDAFGFVDSNFNPVALSDVTQVTIVQRPPSSCDDPGGIVVV